MCGINLGDYMNFVVGVVSFEFVEDFIVEGFLDSGVVVIFVDFEKFVWDEDIVKLNVVVGSMMEELEVLDLNSMYIGVNF